MNVKFWRTLSNKDVVIDEIFLPDRTIHQNGPVSMHTREREVEAKQSCLQRRAGQRSGVGESNGEGFHARPRVVNI
jgi:hypothetical protein